ncbi:uncharacterized protein LOC124912142 [Impatiens glandulifera]|uniref:uncharacterized protein LOC124912142 n=1 Tax=Impatiens glandulifera TaxID=253017 RepID=UPI001FB1523E|nr:uncharacterized protein LOC124912142 [Impatiens glandulifera]
MALSDSTETTSVTKQKKIIIRNTHGEKLVGILHETGSKELVILCHGFRSTKETTTISNLAVALAEEGISSFRFDFSGNGESEGTFQYGHYHREVEDLRSVVQFFNGGNLKASTILGHSKGGNVVLLYASKYHEINTVINISGRYKLDRGMEERLGQDFLERIKKDGYIDIKNKTEEVYFRVTEESLMNLLNTNMHEACLNISKETSVMTVHGSEDEITPIDDAIEFPKIIPNHKLSVIEGADHFYTSHQAELAAIVVSFIKDCLQKGD